MPSTQNLEVKRDALNEIVSSMCNCFQQLRDLGRGQSALYVDLQEIYQEILDELTECEKAMSDEHERDIEHLAREYERSAG